MGVTSIDPFTFTYQALWKTLTDFQPWVDAVKGRYLRFDTTDIPGNFDQLLQNGDCPFVALEPSSYMQRPYGHDCAALDMTLSFPLVIVGADLNIIPVNQVKWHTTRALIKAGPQLDLPKLIQKVGVRSGSDRVGTPDAWTKGQIRITTMLVIDIDLAIFAAQAIAGTYQVT